MKHEYDAPDYNIRPMTDDEYNELHDKWCASMMDPPDPARRPTVYDAECIEPKPKRTPRALTHEIRWLLALGFVACVSGVVALWLLTWGMW